MMLIYASFSAFMLVKSIRLFYQVRRRTAVRQNDFSNEFMGVLVWGFFLCMALAAIIVNYMDPT